MSFNKTADTTGRPVDLTASERHSLLGVERRRLAIELLAGKTPPINLETLATEIIAR